MQSAAIRSQDGALQVRASDTRRLRMLASASFLVVGLAIGGWPTHAQAQAACGAASPTSCTGPITQTVL